MANVDPNRLRILQQRSDGSPITDQTPLLRNQHHVFDDIQRFRALRFNAPEQNGQLLHSEVIAVLMNPSLFQTCNTRIRSPLPYSRFLSSTTTLKPRRYDDLVYGNYLGLGIIDCRKRHTIQPLIGYKPGPVFMLDSRSRRTQDRTLTRINYTLKFHSVDYRLIEYVPIPAAAVVGNANPVVEDQVLDGVGVENEIVGVINPDP